MKRLILFIAGAILISVNLEAKDFLPLSVYFADLNTGWLYGTVIDRSSEEESDSYSAILKTEDGGENWRVVFKFDESKGGFSGDGKIHFLDQNTGLICIRGRLFKTIDRGESWFCLNDSLPLSSVSFINENIGWAVGGYLGGVGSKSVFKTIDGGKTWLEAPKVYGPYLLTVFFKDEKTGWLGGGLIAAGGPPSLSYATRGTILKTVDGEGWLSQDRYEIYQGHYSSMGAPKTFVEIIHFIDYQIGFAAGMTQLFRTSNGGESWDPSPLGSRMIIESIFFKDGIGWLAGSRADSYPSTYGTILKTVDNGEEWIRKFSFEEKGRMNDIYFLDGIVGWAVGFAEVNENGSYKEKGHLLKTINGGVNWSVSPIEW